MLDDEDPQDAKPTTQAKATAPTRTASPLTPRRGRTLPKRETACVEIIAYPSLSGRSLPCPSRDPNARFDQLRLSSDASRDGRWDEVDDCTAHAAGLTIENRVLARGTETSLALGTADASPCLCALGTSRTSRPSSAGPAGAPSERLGRVAAETSTTRPEHFGAMFSSSPFIGMPPVGRDRGHPHPHIKTIS